MGGNGSGFAPRGSLLRECENLRFESDFCDVGRVSPGRRAWPWWLWGFDVAGSSGGDRTGYHPKPAPIRPGHVAKLQTPHGRDAVGRRPRSLATGSMSTTTDEPGEEPRQPVGAEVVEARPARLDGDAHHRVIHEAVLAFRTQCAAPRPTISKPPRCIRRGRRRPSPAWPGRESAGTSRFQIHCPRQWSALRLGGLPVPGPSARSSPCRQRCACRASRTRPG